MDGDQAGTDYIANLVDLDQPPERIISWPEDWSIENVVGWITAADVTVLQDEDLVELGLPHCVEEFVASLKESPLKGDEVAHSLIADAISRNESCAKRTQHVLSVIGAISADREIPEDLATLVNHENGRTKIWSFSNAVQGI